MKRFMAYFDYLGFKDFIMNNPLEYQEKYVSNIFRDIENALAKQKIKRQGPGAVVADLSGSNLHCINFSDTIIYYTNDDSFESLAELFEVAFLFNWMSTLHFFPVRGCIHYGECLDRRYSTKTGDTGSYNVNSLVGKGLIEAYQKADFQSWASTVIDESVIQYLKEKKGSEEDFLKHYARKRVVPYKGKPENKTEEYVFDLVVLKGEKLSETAFMNLEKMVRENFSKHNKSVKSERVQEIIENTISLLKSYM